MGRNHVTRRFFLVASGALLFHPTIVRAGEGKSKVVEMQEPRLLDDNEPDPDRIRSALSLGIRKLTDQEDGPTAWRTLFSPVDVIGIKLNHVAADELRGNREVAHALIAELADAGIPAKRIMVIEGEAVPGTSRADSDADRTKFHACEKALWFKKYITSQVTALVNVPLLKHHVMSGVSLGMKNLSHGTIWNPSHFHQTHCDPAIAEIVSLPPLRSKLRLTVCNALFGLADGGPYVQDRKFIWKPSSLLLSTDVVALDSIGLSIIRDRRRTMGLPTLEEAGQPPAHIGTAEKLNLGTADPARIVHVRLS